MTSIGSLASAPVPDSVALAEPAPARKKAISVYLLLSLGLLDLLMTVVAFVLAYWLRFGSGWFVAEEVQSFHSYLWFLVLQLVLSPIVFAVQGLYRPKRAFAFLDRFYSIFTACSITLTLDLVASTFVSRDFDFSRLMIALAWMLSILLILLGRIAHAAIQGWLRGRGVGSDRVIVVGTGDIAQTVLERIQASPQLGYHPIGFVSATDAVAQVDGFPVLGGLDDIAEIIRRHQVDEVIVALPTLSQDELLDIIGRCRGAKIGIKVFPDLFRIMATEVNIDDLNGLPLVNVRDVALTGWNLAIKRAMDLVIGFAALVCLSPLMLTIALLIKLTSPGGPVFYVQERVGLDGKPFMMLKFRSMVPDAEKDTGPVWAKEEDPRRTRFGSFLRKTSLDELPQFINVIMGDMSLVGPRPERPYFVEQFRQTIPYYFERHREKAGITGWAQINGLRGNTSIEERTAYDLWYVENWTPWLDLKILARSLFIPFKDKNAY